MRYSLDCLYLFESLELTMKMYWKYFFCLCLFCLSACSSHSIGKNKKSTFDLLVGDAWVVSKVKRPIKTLHVGLQFVSDHQVFNLDSQGRPIMSIHDHTFSLNSDTLTLVDHRYSKEFLKSRGTQIYCIQELSEHRLVLSMVYPDSTNRVVLERKNE